MARQPDSVVCSCNLGLNLDGVVEMLWKYLDLIRVYTKKPGASPDFTEPLILRSGATIEHVVRPGGAGDTTPSGQHAAAVALVVVLIDAAGVIDRGAQCHVLHRSLASQFRYAIVWGASAKYSSQRVGLRHPVCDEDVVQIVKK